MDTRAAKHILLIRHGETQDNHARVLQTPESALSANGQAQAKKLATRLAGQPVGLVLHSDMWRATQTAEAIVETTGVPARSSALLRERNFGDLRGQAYADLGFDFFAPDYTPPNGESWSVFEQRVSEAWQHVLSQTQDIEGHCVVVTHGLVCRAIARNHLQLSSDTVLPDKFHNTSVTVIESRAPHRALSLNEIPHLHGDAVSTHGGAV